MYLFLDIMVGMGYSQEEIQESLSKMKYDEITATYLLLGRKSSEVSSIRTNAKKQRNQKVSLVKLEAKIKSVNIGIAFFHKSPLHYKSHYSNHQCQLSK